MPTIPPLPYMNNASHPSTPTTPNGFPRNLPLWSSKENVQLTSFRSVIVHCNPLFTNFMVCSPPWTATSSATHLEIPRLYTTSRFVVFTGNRHGPCPEFQQNQRILQNLRPYVLKANSNSTKFVSRQAIIQNVYRKISTERFESRWTNHARQA